jgi:hypothetical protein
MNYNEYGLLPDTPEELSEIQNGCVTFDSFISGEWALGPYPQTKYLSPPDVAWDSFVPELEKRKAHFDKLRDNGWCLWWWEIAKAYSLPMDDVLWWDQWNYPSCAGFSAAAAYTRKVIYQLLTAPIIWEKINPLPTWAITKNYSVSGGASMAQVKLGVAKYGNYAASDPGIGQYPGKVDRDSYAAVAATAQQRQLCTSRMPNDVDALQLCLDALEVVAMGNSLPCRTSRIDDKTGIKLGVVGGTSWAHATNYDAIRYVKNVPYFHFSNSYGNYYRGSREHCPDIGCWHTKAAAAEMLKTASCWVTVYAEAKPMILNKSVPFMPPVVPVPDYVVR